MQPRFDNFIEILCYRIGFEQNIVVYLKHRHLAMGRDFEEPVGLVLQVDVGNFEVDVFSTH